MNRRIVFAIWLGMAVWAAPLRADSYGSWAVYWDFADGIQLLKQFPAAFSELGLFCYQFNSRGQLIPGNDSISKGVADMSAAAPSAHVWLSVVNDVVEGRKRTLKDPSRVHKMLASPKTRAAHIRDLLAISTGTAGVEIDYENLWFRDRDAFSVFIRELADALHARQQRLAVVVQPKVRDQQKDGADAIDWAGVAGAADVVKVMAYHFHHAKGEPGPIAPPDWVARLTKFALETIPREKLVLVLSVSGFDWPHKGTGQSIDYPTAIDMAHRHGAKVERDPATSSPHFSYPGDPRHEVWFEDTLSLENKLETLKHLGISRVDFWRLGAGDPAFWATLTTN